MSSRNYPILTGEQARVLLFTGFFSSGLALGGLLWILVLINIGLLIGIEFYIILWLALTPIAGLLFQFAIFAIQRKRFHNPVTNPDLLELFSQVKKDLGKGQDIELWFRDLDRSIFLSTLNPLFKAILLSEGATDVFLKKQEKGKIVLAKEVLAMERVSPIRRLVLGLAVFIFFPLLLAFTNLWELLFGISSIIGSDIQFLYIIFIMVGFPLFLILSPLAVIRYNRYFDNTIRDMYGCSYEAARIELLTGRTISDEAAEKRKADKIQRTYNCLKNTVILGVTIAAITIVIVFLAMLSLLPGTINFLQLPIALSACAGFVAFFVVYLFTFIFPMTD